MKVRKETILAAPVYVLQRIWDEVGFKPPRTQQAVEESQDDLGLHIV